MTYDNHVEDDEFHPNPQVAAFYADEGSREFARKTYKSHIARLEAIPDRGAREQNELDTLRKYLADVEQRIKDAAESDPEE
jgi:tRNA C32,U32 (ribose-2'-O)-methylase TrmJ